jgi:SAM-dependent methyltransferase
MNFFIDKFMKIGGAFIIHGWSERFRPGDRLVINSGDTLLETVTRPIMRLDLRQHFGTGAELWGFRAYGIDEGRDSLQATSVGLKFANGEKIENLASACVPKEDHLAHVVWANFIAEANAKGGRLVEIGSRARSGSTIRNQLGSNVEYIGIDVTDGPNVDIVADAHNIADFIKSPVDYVCSISTFEHFIMPWKVVLEINKILVPGGKVFSHSHQTWPEHDVPYDFFRFSDQAWFGLFNAHTGFQVNEVKSGHPVAVLAKYNVGGPFEEMEHSPGYAMSVCVAQKISDVLVEWNAPMNSVRKIGYDY